MAAAGRDVYVRGLGSDAGQRVVPDRQASPLERFLGWRGRFRVWLRRRRLDRELAAGGPLGSSDLHDLRAQQLSERSLRHQVAASLRRVVDDAGQPYVVLNALSMCRPGDLMPLCSSEVLECSEGLLGLADRLDAAAAVNPRGVARARVLLRDGTGPLYNPCPSHELGETIWWIADGLQLGPPHRLGFPV